MIVGAEVFAKTPEIPVLYFALTEKLYSEFDVGISSFVSIFALTLLMLMRTGRSWLIPLTPNIWTRNLDHMP